MLWAQTQPERAIITILTAYLACEDSLMGGVRDAIKLVREYGFLTSTMRQANCAGVSLSNALRLIGVIQLSAREFALSTHPYTVGHVGEHLRENEGWITTLELRDLLDSGDMMEATACEVVYWVGTKPSIKLPARDLASGSWANARATIRQSSIIVRVSSSATPTKPPTYARL